MNKENFITLAGAIGGKQGSGGGSISGQKGSGKESDNYNNNPGTCIIVESLKFDDIVYIQKLRKWRDEVLLQFILGKVLVRTYYIISPMLVKLSRRVPVIKKPIAKTVVAIANII